MKKLGGKWWGFGELEKEHVMHAFFQLKISSHGIWWERECVCVYTTPDETATLFLSPLLSCRSPTFSFPLLLSIHTYINVLYFPIFSHSNFISLSYLLFFKKIENHWTKLLNIICNLTNLYFCSHIYIFKLNFNVILYIFFYKISLVYFLTEYSNIFFYLVEFKSQI